jgi:hypothetical protein
MQFLLADYTEEVLRPMHFLDPSTTQGLIVLGAIAVAIILGLMWAIIVKPSRKRHHSHHHHHHDRPQQFGKDPLIVDEEDEEDEDEDGDEPRKKRRRRRRREHRPRNPTLAETGGLPPVRTEDPPGP